MPKPQIEPEYPPQTYCGGAGNPALPGEPTGVGGNSTLTNQNEREVSEQSWEQVSCSYEGHQENFSHVQGEYRRSGV